MKLQKQRELGKQAAKQRKMARVMSTMHSTTAHMRHLRMNSALVIRSLPPSGDRLGQVFRQVSQRSFSDIPGDKVGDVPGPLQPPVAKQVCKQRMVCFFFPHSLACVCWFGAASAWHQYLALWINSTCWRLCGVCRRMFLPTRTPGAR